MSDFIRKGEIMHFRAAEGEPFKDAVVTGVFVRESEGEIIIRFVVDPEDEEAEEDEVVKAAS